MASLGYVLSTVHWEAVSRREKLSALQDRKPELACEFHHLLPVHPWATCGPLKTPAKWKEQEKEEFSYRIFIRIKDNLGRFR